ncbi:MAG: rhodanese-like domain-containing protein [Pirellulaceae bacterium]
MSVSTITPRQLLDKVNSGEAVELIDVRTPVEYREVHAEPAKNVPLDQLDAGKLAQGRNGDGQPLYVICRSGSRANQACEKIQAAGYENVVNVEGGTLAWDEQGLPVARGKKSISLERQVRIAAGSLVVLGAVLAVTVNIWFVALAAFVGAGLVLAGVTDTCGMGMLLAKMPWNQVKSSASSTNSEAGQSCDLNSKSSCCG